MSSLIEQWRQEEKADLDIFYDLLEKICRDNGKIAKEDVSRAIEILGLPRHRITVGAKETTMVIGMASEAIEIGVDAEKREARLRQIERYRKAICVPAKWNRYQDVHEHIIHMHLKRIHSEDLKKAFEGQAPMASIPYRIDRMEADAMSVHFLSTRCRDVDCELNVTRTHSPTERKKILERALGTLVTTGPRWGTIPGMTVRGIQIHANYKNDLIEIDGDTAKIQLKGMPESFKYNDFTGKALHDLIDIDGFKDERIRINRTIIADKVRINNTMIQEEVLVIKFNRYAEHQRIVIEPRYDQE